LVKSLAAKTYGRRTALVHALAGMASVPGSSAKYV
jgi:hypothetical protein